MTPDTDAPAETLHYTLFAVFRRDPHAVPAAEDAPALADVADGLASVRGIYDVSGLRADADVMLWLTGHTADGLQADLRALRRSRELSVLLPTWNAMGVHRTAEFARDHVPAYARGLPPKQWLTIYPFVRSYEWYLLPDAERGAMLRDHGLMGRDFPQVQANTVASFALGDYEWLLPMESDDVVDLVDMMRHLRSTEARRHVREEIPFFTGRLIGASEVAEVLA
ncbi:hydrogen peroxide-dependent heme synthase [Microbacterium thalassium]|uniref:Coproheme decarboxylase n=1 Tax=Microbacterium thalassium TaxID=362649 RepID=A0A7X0KVP7_9MICO|nr:hydrogen peroxide-dependent heme synthase [Microbacterium thalassium]MBB6392462.1 chlorite dismutase [Microbacterium thalassium]GLK23306.1 chlorite dismutase [Microbacterium thalassium]